MYAVLNSQTMGYTLIQGHEITLHSEQGWLDNKAENKFHCWMKFTAFHQLHRRDCFHFPCLQLSFMERSHEVPYLISLWSNCHLNEYSALHFVGAHNPANDSGALAFSVGFHLTPVVASSRALIVETLTASCSGKHLRQRRWLSSRLTAGCHYVITLATDRTLALL